MSLSKGEFRSGALGTTYPACRHIPASSPAPKSLPHPALGLLVEGRGCMARILPLAVREVPWGGQEHGGEHWGWPLTAPIGAKLLREVTLRSSRCPEAQVQTLAGLQPSLLPWVLEPLGLAAPYCPAHLTHTRATSAGMTVPLPPRSSASGPLHMWVHPALPQGLCTCGFSCLGHPPLLPSHLPLPSRLGIGVPSLQNIFDTLAG